MTDTKSKLAELLREGDELERCGLVLKDGEIIETLNAHEDPAKGFAILARDMHDNEGEIASTWHTHPDGDSGLSHEDYIGFGQWPGITHYVVSPQGVREYEVFPGGIILEVQELEVADAPN